jgi:hypothetical protein
MIQQRRIMIIIEMDIEKAADIEGMMKVTDKQVDLANQTPNMNMPENLKEADLEVGLVESPQARFPRSPSMIARGIMIQDLKNTNSSKIITML